MGVIAALLPQRARLDRVRAAARDVFTVSACADWAAVARACETEAVRLVVCDLYATGAPELDGLRTLRERFARVPVVLYVSTGPDRLAHMLDAGRLGVDAVIVADHDDAPSALVELFGRAERRAGLGALRGALETVRATVRDATMLTASRAHTRLTTEDLCRELRVPRRVLARRLAAAHFPSPQRLITWGRLIMAAHMLEDARCPVDRAARAFHFPSPSAFRNMCRRYLRATPTEIRARGGAGYAIRVLVREARPAEAMPFGSLHVASRRPRVAV